MTFSLWLARNGHLQDLTTWGYPSVAENLLNHKHSEKLVILSVECILLNVIVSFLECIFYFNMNLKLHLSSLAIIQGSDKVVVQLIKERCDTF